MGGRGDLHVLNHLPSMVHIIITLPISIHPTGQELLTVIPSWTWQSPGYKSPNTIY